MTVFASSGFDPSLEKSAGKIFGDGSVPGDTDPLAQSLWLDRERQVKALTVELGQALDGRTTIYLDTCFWIHLRDAQRGELGVRGAEFLGRVRGAVATGAAIFPISDMTLFEVLKQSPESRTQTAGLMAELSQGVAIVDARRRIATEICHLMKTAPPGIDPELFHPLRHLVWTRGLGVMGLNCPYIPGMDVDQSVAIQRGVLERLWRSVGPDQIIAAFEGFEDDEFQDLVADLNLATARHGADLDNFKTAYGAEAGGVADLAADMAMDIFVAESRAAGHAPPLAGTQAWSERRSRWCGLIAAGLSKGPKPRRRLRTLHAFAALHAAFRWNKGQKFEVNDIYDFEHAAAALAYCQVFLTERPLHHMVTAGNLKLDQLFDCQVFHGLDAAIDAIAMLAGGPRRQPKN